MTHRCNLPHCDGTDLGHELARDFPEETRQINEAFDRLRGSREDRVMPENLQVDEEPMDPMDRPPADHGSDRYDYVELIGAPPNVAPHGAWWDQLLAEPCPDCRANIFATYEPDSPQGWSIVIAHDDGCPTLKKHEEQS